MGEQVLRLVGDDNRGRVLATIEGVAPEPERVLVAEADSLEAWHGPNHYSTFLRKHRRRPDRGQAATIGRLLGGRVEASDGSLQPPLTKADRQIIRDIKARRKAASRRYDHILRLRDAIAALSENIDDPADVIGSGSCLLSGPEISAKLDNAVCWLNRFAAEWHAREKDASTGGQKLSGQD